MANLDALRNELCDVIEMGNDDDEDQIFRLFDEFCKGKTWEIHLKKDDDEDTLLRFAIKCIVDVWLSDPEEYGDYIVDNLDSLESGTDNYNVIVKDLKQLGLELKDQEEENEEEN